MVCAGDPCAALNESELLLACAIGCVVTFSVTADLLVVGANDEPVMVMVPL